MSVYSPSEILEFAVKIEENGERYYRRFADELPEQKAKELFIYLAEEEKKHEKTFRGMLSKVESYEPSESYSDEYFAYLRAYVEDVVFSSETLEKELESVKNVADALDFGLRRELESIVYYQEVRKLVTRERQDVIDGIIEEERRHYTKLHEVKNFFTGRE